jgi:hypothetical protein
MKELIAVDAGSVVSTVDILNDWLTELHYAASTTDDWVRPVVTAFTVINGTTYVLTIRVAHTTSPTGPTIDGVNQEIRRWID